MRNQIRTQHKLPSPASQINPKRNLPGIALRKQDSRFRAEKSRSPVWERLFSMHRPDDSGLSDNYRNFAAFSSIGRHSHVVFAFGAQITANIDLRVLMLLHVYQGQELVIDLDFNEINPGLPFEIMTMCSVGETSTSSDLCLPPS